MKIAFLTSGGIAPCLSASIGRLTENYLKNYPNAEIIGYLNGYKGLLLGNSISFPKTLKGKTDLFYNFGGSPIGNSRVKLKNTEDCVSKGYIKEGEKHSFKRLFNFSQIANVDICDNYIFINYVLRSRQQRM